VPVERLREDPDQQERRADIPAPLAVRFAAAELLGSGGMAAVYRAWDREAERVCAVKVLGELLSRDEEFRRRFRREAASAAGLVHPHIVAVYGSGDAAGRYFITMEYVAGGTLHDLLRRRGPLPEADALRIAAEVADALAYAHDRGVVHRDIKPHNILLTPDGDVKVADFGIARTLDATYLTRTGTLMGSAHYISPEQARGDQAGPASDLYALGVVLYEMLAGRVPFDGEAPVAIALKHLHEAPPDIVRARPDVSPETAALVGRLLAKSPEDRHPSARDVAADLRRVLGGLRRLDGSETRPLADRTMPLHRPADEPRRRTARLPAGAGSEGGAPRPGATAVLPAPVAGARGMEARPRWPVWARAALTLVVLGFLAALAAGIYRATWLAMHVPVPSLVGRTVGDAGRAVLPLELRVVVSARRQDPRAGVGVILAQDPPPGREVARGAVVRLTVSQGSGVVPDLHGLAVLQAARQLEAAGLRLGRVSYTYDDRTASGAVIYQFVGPGTRLAPNGAVDVLVSQGPPPFPLKLTTPWFVPNPRPDPGGSR